MVITKDTDPSTLMFEGHPDVIIGRITPAFSGTGFYVVIESAPKGTKFGCTFITPGMNHKHAPDGTDVSHSTGDRWPRVVPRTTRLDHTRPLRVTYLDGSPVPKGDEYEFKAVVQPLDGTKAYYVVGPKGSSHPLRSLRVDPDTGRVMSGHKGSQLQFSNVPPKVTEHHTIWVDHLDRYVPIVVTCEGGEVTDIQLR